MQINIWFSLVGWQVTYECDHFFKESQQATDDVCWSGKFDIKGVDKLCKINSKNSIKSNDIITARNSNIDTISCKIPIILLFLLWRQMKIRKRKDFANDISRLKCNLTVEWFGILLENSIAIQVKTIVYNKDVVLSFFFVFRRLIYSNENDTERRTRRTEPPRVIIRSRSAGTSPFF